ncbi:MAG: helix-turn-helix domain-containing protein [Eggerthellaceae bacterium]|nr:helix-turn-helix domain-containing protein [Eggerthellaceae bacterium]
MGKHGVEVREKAAELIDSGYGKAALANALAISVSIAEHWIHSYKAVGKEVFLGMGSKHRTYDRETKLAAVLDFLEGGLTKQEAMAKHAIASLSAFERWVREYREGGPEALAPKPKGRPRKAGGEASPPPTREQELEAENRRLRAEVAYLKKLRALEAAKRAPGRNAR